MAESVGLSRMAFYHRAQREGLSIPLSYPEFRKIALDVATSTRINDNQRRAILNLVKSETSVSEPEHLPFFRSAKSNIKVETKVQAEAPKVDFEVAKSPMFSRAEPETKILEEEVIFEPKTTKAPQPVSDSAGKVETEKLTYAHFVGESIRKLDGLSKVLMLVSMGGISWTIYLYGSGFVLDPRFQILFGLFAVWAAYNWEHALKAQINSVAHQFVYREWGSKWDLVPSVLILLLLLGPNMYQGFVAGVKLASIVTPVHNQDDGSGINRDLINEKDAIAANYERTRQTLKQEQESAALADPTVAKFADYERSERNSAQSLKNAANARRGEAAKYRNKGQTANANWCLHLAKEKDKEAKRAEDKADQWRAKKEQASAAVYAAYASKFTELERQEKSEREKVESRYTGILATHTLSENQLRAQSERQNKSMRGIGFIFLTVADLAIIALIFAKVAYFRRTNQVDPTLKEYKVGEKSKLEQFLGGVITPAWDTIFGVIMQVGYRYQAMAQASLDGAGAIQQLMKERAVVRHQKYQERIAKRIEEMKKK